MSFSDYLQKQEMSAVELPLVHTTDCFTLRLIERSHQVQASYCAVFNEALLYTFYGKPAYRDSRAVSPVRDVSFFPVCFVFKPGMLFGLAKRLYPFDTGASQIGLYEPVVSASDALVDYELTAAADTARRIVRCFFDVDQGYLGGRAKDGMAFAAGDTQANSYYKLIRGGGDPECDDRCSTIEVQLGSDLDLRSALLMAVILPIHFLDDASLRQTLLKSWKAQPLTYYADLGMRPLEFHGVIRHLVYQFYNESSLV